MIHLNKLEIASIYGSLVGVVSTIFMVWTFYNESLLGRGVLFIEPNRTLALGELIAAVVGLLILGFLMFAFVFHPTGDSKGKEPFGHGNGNKGVYA